MPNVPAPCWTRPAAPTCHFKDFLREDAGGQLAATGAGQGGMGDYRTILRFAKQEKPWVFATLENTTPENSVQCLQYLQKQYDAC